MNLLAHYLLPHHTNNHKAKIIRPAGLSLLLSLFLVFELVIRGVSSVGPQILGYAANISPSEVIRLTNEKRAQSGLAPVVYNAALSQAAQAKASHMINKGYWAHVAPDGTQPWSFFTNAGYRYKYAGENLARDFSNPSSTVDAWMASPSHRDNMLSGKYKEIGVAVIDGQLAGVETTVVVQFFGTRTGDTLPTQPVAVKVNSATSAPTQTVKPTKKPQSPGPTATATTEVIVEVRPTDIPVPQATPIEVAQKVLVSPLNVTKGLSSVIVSILLIVLLIDMVIISRRRISRISGRSFAHFAFFAMILTIVVMLKAGNII